MTSTDTIDYSNDGREICIMTNTPQIICFSALAWLMSDIRGIARSYRARETGRGGDDGGWEMQMIRGGPLYIWQIILMEAVDRVVLRVSMCVLVFKYVGHSQV